MIRTAFSVPVLSVPALSLCMLLAANPAAAQGDVEAGKTKSVTCQACHGADGNGTGDGQYPRIAGQYADYLSKTLRDYRSGERQNAIMAGFAGSLKDQDIDDLAEYFAAQDGPLKDLTGTH